MIEERILIHNGEIKAHSKIVHDISTARLLSVMCAESDDMSEDDALSLQFNEGTSFPIWKHYNEIENVDKGRPKGTIYVQLHPPLDLRIAKTAQIGFFNSSDIPKKVRIWCILDLDYDRQFKTL